MPASEVNVTVYTPTELQAWTLELQANKQQVNERTVEITTQERRLTSLRNALSQKDRDIRWSKNQIETLRMQDMMYTRSSARYPYPYYHNSYEARLIAELDRLYAERRQIVIDKEACETTKNLVQNQRKQLELRGAWLAQHLPAAESFLSALEHEPQRLVDELKQKLLNAIDTYEEQHFMGLTVQVRMSLWQIRHGLEQVLIASPDAREQRLNYLRLCGFLGELYARLPQEKKEEHFLNALVAVINSTHVRSQDDLPESLKTGASAQACFKAVQDQYPLIFMKDERELVNEERILYLVKVSSYSGLESSPKTELQRKIIHALQTLQAEVTAKVERKEAIDYHFYTRIAMNLTNLYNNPADVRAATRLGDMAEYATGAASLGKKLLGSLLVVLGLLLIAASIAILLSPVGACSVFSAWGLALGMDALVTEAVSAAGLYVAGTGLSAWGVFKFDTGRRHGFSKELHEVQELAQVGPSL